MSLWPNAYEEHGPAILAFLRRRLRRPEEAEDLRQETFLRAMVASAGLRDERKLRSYLFRTARNLLLNHLRRPSDLIRTQSDLGETVVLEEMADPTRATPEAAARSREIRDRLDAILPTLPADHRRAFELAVLEQRSYAEVVEQTGWSLAKVKTDVFRARRRVLAELGDLLPANGGERDEPL